MLESSETRRRWCHAGRLPPEMTTDQPKTRAATQPPATISLRSAMPLLLPFDALLGFPFPTLLCFVFLLLHFGEVSASSGTGRRVSLEHLGYDIFIFGVIHQVQDFLVL